MNYLYKISLGFSVLLAAMPGAAQHVPLDIGGGYTYTHTNIAPGCSCFSLPGGHAQVQLGVTSHVAFIANFDAGTRAQITPDNYQLTQLTYTFGGRYTALAPKRLSLFGEVLIGGAHALGTLSPRNNAIGGTSNAVAFRTGGGLSLRLMPRVRIVPIAADYLLTNFRNGATNRQNDLQVSAGVLFRLTR